MPPMLKKNISVILPVFNRENYINMAIKSILAQSYSEFELIVVDDGSCDRTSEILTSYTKRDSRVSVYRNEVNKGIIFSINKAIGLSHGDFVARMDSDDISFSRRFEKQIEYLAKSEVPCVLGTQFQKINDKGRIIKTRSYRECAAKIVWWDMFFYPSVVHPTIMAHREIMNRFNKSNLETSFPDAEDHAFWLRIGFEIKIENLPDVLFYFRRHDSRITHPNNWVQATSSEKAIQNALKKATGKDVSLKAIQSFKYLKHDDNYEVAHEAMNTLMDLYTFFLNSYTLTFFEKKRITDKLKNLLLHYREAYQFSNMSISKNATELLDGLM